MSAVAQGRRLGSIAAVIAAATVFGLTYGLSAPLVAVDLAERGLPEWLIGLNAAMHAVGVFAQAQLRPVDWLKLTAGGRYDRFFYAIDDHLSVVNDSSPSLGAASPKAG